MATPVLTATPAVEVTLSLFGGTDTEISPVDVPEGLSPDNQDMIFLPGDTSSRPCMSALFPAPFPSGVSVVYQKTYIQPNNQPITLILTSDGKLWAEYVAISPGVYTQLGAVPKGLYAQSVSAFGREYLAFSDLLHGQGVPLQYDGTFLDRVTMDGPGAAPSAADENVSFPIVASPAGLVSVAALNVRSASQNGNVVTMQIDATGFGVGVTAALNAFKQGSLQVKIAGVGAGYDGTFPVTGLTSFVVPAVPSPKRVFTLTYSAPTLGLTPKGAGGTALFSLTILTSTVNLPYTTVNVAAGSVVVEVAGAGVSGYNANWTAVYFDPVGAPTVLYLNLTTFGLAASGNGTLSTVGNISIGQHQVVMMWLTRQGAIPAPSPIASWTAAGGKRVVLSNLPIGPGNVMARLFGMTGAGGDNFFILPTSTILPQPSGPPIITPALVVLDNTSTSVTLDFSDNALFAGIPIDQVGNDLFDQRVLGPVLGFFGYASRLACWGDYNKVENLLNPGFCGGYLSGALAFPLGWDVSTPGGTLISGGSWASGLIWQVTGDASGQNLGQLSQSAYEDSFGDAIIQPNTAYSLRFWGLASANPAGVVTFYLTSASTGFSATVAIQSSSLIGGFTPLAAFSLIMPAVIPNDLRFGFYVAGQNVGETVEIGEIEVIPTEDPYNNVLSHWSYDLNPEAFAQTTGDLGASDDDSALQNFSLQKNTGLLHTAEATHEFTDNTFEPGDGGNGWDVSALTHSVGALSLRACDPGKFGTGDSAEDWDIIASKNGVYIHLGSSFYKVAQEMSRTVATSPFAVTWDDINWEAQQTIWVKNVVNKRYALIGVPVNGASAPNLIFVLDYREMDTAAQIASALPIHITLTGKMKSSDMTRKWTRWNISANCAEVLIRPGNVKELFLGGGSGSTPGTGVAYGNLYSLDPTKLTDDDYGQMKPYYITYAFIDHDQEQQLQLGSARHFYRHISAFITGVGLVTITPLVNSLINPLPSTTPRQLSQDNSLASAVGTDLEWSTTIHGQRVFFLITVNPLPGSTDVQLKLQKLIVLMQKDPVALFRGSRL